TAAMRCLSMVLMVLASQLQSIQRRAADDHIPARGHAFKAYRIDDGAELLAELCRWQRIDGLLPTPSGIAIVELSQRHFCIRVWAQGFSQKMRNVLPLVDGPGRNR